MPKAPKVSIVLPVWNGERYLSYALDSILAQTFTDFECLIVNDCSSDSSPYIAESYAARDKRFHVLHNEKNLRLPASLNRGFSAASGEYYTWTSDDNVLHADFLEVMLAEMLKNNADLVYSDYNAIDEHGSLIKIAITGPSENLIFDNSIGASFLYKKRVHKDISGFNEQLFLFEDYDFWVRAYLHGFKFYHSSQVVYDYRIHNQSLSATRSIPDSFVWYRYAMLNKFKNVSKNAKSRAYTNLIFNGRRILNNKQLLELFCKALYVDPLRLFRLVCTRSIDMLRD